VRDRLGLSYGLAAYTIWGSFPLYFPLLAPAGALEVLTQRVLWSLVVCGLLVAALSLAQRRRGRPTVGAELGALVRRPRDVGLLGVAALLIGANWLVFIHLSLTARPVEASLGYYATPLVSVLLAVVLLRERLRALQVAALVLGALAVVLLTVEVGAPPLLGLSLAVSFALYGLAKKRIGRGVSALAGLTVETALLAPFALAVVAWLTASGRATFGSEGTGHALLMASAGVVTAVPLLLFGAAARRLSLTAVGMLQYLTPTLQLVLGVLVIGEAVPGPRWAGFALVWLALVVFTVDALRSGRGAADAARRTPPRVAARAG
jgi:chloramphenicol-sensitive protein RarD